MRTPKRPSGRRYPVSFRSRGLIMRPPLRLDVVRVNVRSLAARPARPPPMTRPYSITSFPFAMSRMATLWPSGTSSTSVTARTGLPSSVIAPISAPVRRSSTATPTSSSGSCIRIPCFMCAPREVPSALSVNQPGNDNATPDHGDRVPDVPRAKRLCTESRAGSATCTGTEARSRALGRQPPGWWRWRTA